MQTANWIAMNWDPELQAMHVDVLPSWQLAKARPTFSPNCTESVQCSVMLLEKICILHKCFEHIGCPKKLL